ncbi:MAG TPA: hypothetical protein VMW13_05110 [Dehalococcoidales bacterium]|nr:hypothetical protein [Dehalococcoidales bacterium]
MASTVEVSDILSDRPVIASTAGSREMISSTALVRPFQISVSFLLPLSFCLL